MNSGRAQAKIGVSELDLPSKTPISFVLLDNSHLTAHGIKYFCALSKQCLLITSNQHHPAYDIDEQNLHIMYQETLDLTDVLTQLCETFHCKRITIQTGGTHNKRFLEKKLFDYIDIVITPVLIGGHATSTLIDGASLHTSQELSKLGIL